MNSTELATPDNGADCTVELRISGNRLVSVLNALDAALHATGRYRFEGDNVKGASDWFDNLRATTEAIRDELSRQRRGMTPAVLFNCCTDNAAPNWSQFAWLETGGCTTEMDETTGDPWTNGGEPDNVAEFWTVYGRLKEGGCEAITDCKTREQVDAVARELSGISGLEVR